MEYVIVKYPTNRFVYIDDEQNGKTNENLRVEAGTHKFDLGRLENYTPESQEVSVSGSSVLEPMEIEFFKKNSQGD